MINPQPNALRVLTLPGWKGAGFAHWQQRWEILYGYMRVEQNDWERPLRGDWIARLEEVLLDGARDRASPSVLVADNLGCLLVAAWAAHSRNTHLVKAALLVAPLDVEQEALQPRLASWFPVLMPRLPFTSKVLAKLDDPTCSVARARQFALGWGADFIVDACVTMKSSSGCALDADDWPRGHELLMQLI